ncbi:MAG TPA: hypothetical protein VKA01_08665 [Vicinamibacteria bacterium]|nr:hypothetical protein [Vicinamibacteria bacterium]
MAASAYWRCPVCLRRVPGKVVECYCGRIRQPGDGPDEEDRAKPSPLAVALPGIGLVVVIAALAVWATRPSSPAPKPGTASPSPRAVSNAPPSPPSTITIVEGPALSYDTAMRDVRRQIRQLETRLARFERQCRPDASRSGCPSLSEQIAREAAAIGVALAAAHEGTRGSVDPAVLTELRRRNGVSERDVQATLSRARAAESATR